MIPAEPEPPSSDDKADDHGQPPGKYEDRKLVVKPGFRLRSGRPPRRR